MKKKSTKNWGSICIIDADKVQKIDLDIRGNLPKNFFRSTRKCRYKDYINTLGRRNCFFGNGEASSANSKSNEKVVDLEYNAGQSNTSSKNINNQSNKEDSISEIEFESKNEVDSFYISPYELNQDHLLDLPNETSYDYFGF